MTEILTESGITNGWLNGAYRHESPNYNERPETDEPQLLVIHNISLPPGRFGGGYIQQFFQNKLDPTVHPYFEEIASLTVSAHLLIERTGQIVQFVPFHCRAWHAGQSEYMGRTNCNDFSIGIELEGADNTPYTHNQYLALARVSNVLLKNYPKMDASMITGHSDIAPERKTDPGPAFNWDYYRDLLDSL